MTADTVGHKPGTLEAETCTRGRGLRTTALSTSFRTTSAASSSSWWTTMSARVSTHLDEPPPPIRCQVNGLSSERRSGTSNPSQWGCLRRTAPGRTIGSVLQRIRSSFPAMEH
jgi:hypothetical protein